MDQHKTIALNGFKSCPPDNEHLMVHIPTVQRFIAKQGQYSFLVKLSGYSREVLESYEKSWTSWKSHLGLSRTSYLSLSQFTDDALCQEQPISNYGRRAHEKCGLGLMNHPSRRELGD
jgi:hypothetical protein